MSQYPPQGQQNPPDQPQQPSWQSQPSQSLPPSQPSGQWKQPTRGNQSAQQFRGQWRQPMQPDMYPPPQQQPMQPGIYPPPQQQQPKQPDMFPPPQQQQPRQSGMFPPPQQQQPRQQGMFPPPQKPIKKSLRNLWIVLGGIVVLLLVCVGIAAAMNSGANSADLGAATQVPAQVAITGTAQSQSITATANQHYKVGQVIKVNNTWQVTINSVKTTNGDTFSTPLAGNTYFIVDVTLKNLSGQAQNISSALNFSLHDGTGQKYTETILTGETPPDGKVPAGALLHGQLTYEVPTAQTFFTFNFEPDLVTGGLTVWDLQR